MLREPLIVEGVIEQPVIYVSYADLNLANEAGVARLNRRVRTAATRLCMQNGFQGVTQEMRDHACRADALTNARRQIDIAVANFGKSQYAAASGKTIAVALR